MANFLSSDGLDRGFRTKIDIWHILTLCLQIILGCLDLPHRPKFTLFLSSVEDAKKTPVDWWAGPGATYCKGFVLLGTNDNIIS
eukprot:6209980-Pleurochrysis_carterae.AAC.1